MFKSYLHIAARHLTRHRLYALTNVGGLAVGLAGCMLMAIWVLGQLETDRFHEHGERIYRVVTQGEKAARLTTPAILGTSLQRETTEVEAVVRMLNVDNPVPLVRSSVQPRRAEADPVSVDLLWVDAGATETLGMTLAAGEGFTENMEPRNGYFVLSQAAVQALGWESADAAVGRTLAIGQAGGTGVSPEGTVVGVVEDFHSGSLRRGIQPVVMQLWPWHNYLLIRFRAHSLQHVVQQVETVMAELDPVHPFEYSLLDDRFAAMYRRDERLGTMFAGFGGLALLVACVGMFGLASFAAQRRRMEFGVRKALGASGVEIGRLLAGELTRLVLVASLLACPIAYFGMAGWMEQFSERAEVGAGPFVAAVAAALVAAWVSVAYHAVRTSRIDPVEALRYE